MSWLDPVRDRVSIWPTTVYMQPRIMTTQMAAYPTPNARRTGVLSGSLYGGNLARLEWVWQLQCASGSEPHVASAWSPSRSFEGLQLAELDFLPSDPVGGTPQETWGN
jgi:hypothetical protein